MIEGALDDCDLEVMADAFGKGAGHRHDHRSAGLFSWLLAHSGLRDIASQACCVPARLVRIVAFNKSERANWFVPWHQDRSIAVRERRDSAGFSRWTIKDGVPHVEAPAELLKAMAALRIHIDDCGEDAGPLEVIPGTHREGPLDKAQIDALAATRPTRLCLAARGDILVMRPLLVHRSQRARTPLARRVLHLEYASHELPSELQWALGSAVPAEIHP